MVAVLRAAGDVADPVYGEILVDRIPYSPSAALDGLLRRDPTRKPDAAVIAAAGNCRPR